MSACKSCGADIIWVRLVSGKRMPVDAKPDREGRVLRDEDRAVVFGSPEAAREVQQQSWLHGAEATLHTSHFATCPNADQHRRRR